MGMSLPQPCNDACVMERLFVEGMEGIQCTSDGTHRFIVQEKMFGEARQRLTNLRNSEGQ